MPPTVLVSGAGVAGLTLATFVARAGVRVIVVERAEDLRSGGYAVDFRGAALGVLDDLGIRAAVARHDTRMTGTALVDDDGTVLAELAAERFAGELEVPKPALMEALAAVAAAAGVEVRFGDTVHSVTQGDDRADVELRVGDPVRADVVVGADGVHSRIRRLTLDPDGRALHHLGMSGVGFTATVDDPAPYDRRGVLCASPGRAVYAFGTDATGRVTASLSFATADDRLDRAGRTAQEAAVRAAFAGTGELADTLLRSLSGAADLTFGSALQVRLDRWYDGRVVLLGDAAWCAAPTSGRGTSLALVGAARLARAILERPPDFASYQADLRPLVDEAQALGLRGALQFGAAGPSAD